MRKVWRCGWVQMAVSGVILLQAGGCTFSQVNELIQTVFLGVTAAGGYVLLRNL